jgi:hypothetical protein
MYVYLPGTLRVTIPRAYIAQLKHPCTRTRTQRDFPPTASETFNLCPVKANTQRRRLLDATDPLFLPGLMSVTDPISFFISFPLLGILFILFFFFFFLLFLFVVVFIVRVSRAEQTHIRDA